MALQNFLTPLFCYAATGGQSGKAHSNTKQEK